MKIGEPRYKN